MNRKASFTLVVGFGLVSMLGLRAAYAQQDPGPRAGAAAAGGNYPTLNTSEQAMFTKAMQTFMEVDSVKGTLQGEGGTGLGPTFNGNSCAQCHAQPAMGGTSPGLKSPQNPVPNPQVALATLDGATNQVPSFITADGPVREARFVFTVTQRGAVPDGGVHGLFTITGRTDAAGCTLAQPDFAKELSRHNVVFRIPTPVFGLGLVESTPDSVLRDNLAATASRRASLGVRGSFNTSGNDGTITRFGWKAQNKSLLVFSGEAYNVEQGVSNDLFPSERSAVAGCAFNPSPEDSSTNGEEGSDAEAFATFARLSAPPTPAASTPSTQNGAQLFDKVGCTLCHSPSLTTGQSRYTGMSNVAYHPYSDFALHHMGWGLADRVTQGAAGGDQFRTAPLWGIGQRLYFLHDGRTSDLLQAIKAHGGRESEANGVVQQFNALTPAQVQDILNFLRSL
ncbi:MAG TPA: di-heme oxidoredictase family protein [Terriglobales bacterium]|nr:di-heme oxidoredictase family protein [Terriglobales bacterium]